MFVLFQIQSITEEKKRLKADLEEAYKRHKEELEIQQLQHFQVSGGEGRGGEGREGAQNCFYLSEGLLNKQLPCPRTELDGISLLLG